MDLEERLPVEEPFGGAPKGEETISLLDIVAVLARRKGFIVLFTVIVAVLVLGFVAVTKLLPPTHPLNKMPDYFQPEVEVILQESSGNGSSLSSVLAQQGLGSVASLLGAGTGATGQSAQLAQYLLDSDLVKDRIGERFGFVERYELQGSSKAKTSIRNMVGGALAYEYQAGPGVLVISYRDTDKAFATRVLNGVVGILEEEFKNITLARVQDKLKDVRSRLQGAEDDLKAAQESLVDFSVKHSIIDIAAQSSEIAGQIGALTSQLTAKELERNGLLNGGRNAGDPLVVRLQSEIDEVKRLLGEMQRGYRTYTPVTTPVDDLPQVSLDYANLKFEVTLRQALYMSLRQSLESVLLEEKDQSSRFQVLRLAEVPEMKAGPSRGKICVIGAVAGFFVAVLLAFVSEYLDRARRDPEESRKLLEIRRLLLRFRK